MKLTFIGAAHEVTGSCHYLEAAGKHILVDCVMEQGVRKYEMAELPIEDAMIDYVLLTPAHGPFRYAAGFICQRISGADTDNDCHSGFVQHYVTGLCTYPDAGSGVEEQEGKATFGYTAP